MASGRRTQKFGRPLVATTLLVMALIASSCSGGGNETAKDSGNRNGSDAQKADPTNCPVDALTNAEGTAGEPVEITAWHGYDALTKQSLDKAVADYNASQNKLKITAEAQGSYPELFKKYSDRLADPSSLPDIIFAQDVNLRFLADSGSVIAAADCIAADAEAAEFYKDLAPIVRTSYSIKGTLWPAAFAAQMPLVFTNRNHLEKAGLDESTKLGTLDELRTVAEKIKAAKVPKVEAPIVLMLDSQYFENWITGAGTEIVDQGNGHDGLATKAKFDNPTTRELLQWLQDMQKDGLLKAVPYGQGIDHYLALAGESSSILIAISRAITSAVALANNTVPSGGIDVVQGIDTPELEGLDIEVSPLAGLTKPGQASIGGSAAYIVAGEKPEKISAAWDFIRYFNSDPVQVQWAKMGSIMPVTSHVQSLPEMVEFFTNDDAGKLLKIATDQMNDVPDDVRGPVIGPFERFKADIQAMLASVVIRGDDIDTAVKGTNSKLQTMLDEYAKEVG